MRTPLLFHAPLLPTYSHLPRRMTPISALRTPKPPSRLATFPWPQTLSAALVHALHASTVYTVPSALILPIRLSLDLTLPQVSFPLNVYRLLNAFFLIPSGHLLDIYGPHTPLKYSIISAALLSLFYPFCGNLTQLVLLQGLFAVTKLMGGLAAMIMIVSRRVQKMADKGENGVGLAVSIVLSGYSFAGVIAPAVVGSLAEQVGWRGASGFMGLLFCVIGIPLTLLFLGDETPSDDDENNNNLDDPNTRVDDPVFTKPFTLLLGIVVLFAIPLHVVFDYLVDFLSSDLKYSYKSSMFHLAGFNATALIAKLAIGPLGDKYNKKNLIIAFSFIMIIAWSLLLDFQNPFHFTLTHSTPKITAFVPLYGLSYAAVYILTTALLPAFGQARLGIRSNIYQMLFMAAAAAGSFLGGQGRVIWGSFAPVFGICVGISGAVFVLSLVFRKVEA